MSDILVRNTTKPERNLLSVCDEREHLEALLAGLEGESLASSKTNSHSSAGHEGCFNLDDRVVRASDTAAIDGKAANKT